MRGAMIAAGVVIVESFQLGTLYFAAFLLLTGIKMLFMKDEDDNNIEDSNDKILPKHLRYTKEIDGHKFFVRLPDHITGKMAIFVTPLFMALICIEFMDVLLPSTVYRQSLRSPMSHS